MVQAKFARVDGRLIHGQVATGWSNSVGINNIYIVDNPTANDDFMKMIYTNLQNTYSFGIKIYTVDEVVKEWNDNQFGSDKVMLLFKDVNHAYETRNAGVPFDLLNLGGSPKTPDNKFVADSVALTEDEFNKLNSLASEHNMDIFFQTMPSASKKKLNEVKY
ncbi:PTS system mannose/fructose/N-acetylgalactosamine-transporter subunit IIB [Fundicoccus sp. Sow4_F4]|uniref:PTS system mannose/fructose/N-acetylgalactosamine-transporter subunit IIB n=1 Tax=Fundicoccus sp. Sow4_F4 TaxID=3438783 RepID=UPI003F8DFFF5